MKNIFLYTLLVILWSCASITPLDGGPKDDLPPKVVHTFPDSAQTLVETREILLQFDEYVQAKDMRNLLVLSPGVAGGLETEIKGKRLIIRVGDTLQPNTTYSLQLNGSIVDNNEGNVLEDYQLYFSTGSYIDSLYYTARIVDAYERHACTDCILALYRDPSDSVMLLERPDYIARTNGQGRVRIPNLAPQSFVALAMQDKNKNLKLDFDEQVSLRLAVQITDSSSEDSFYVFPYLREKKLSVSIASDYPGRIHLLFDPAVPDSFILSSQSDRLAYSKSLDGDSITAYLPISPNDTAWLTYSFDSIVDSIRYVATRAPVNDGFRLSWKGATRPILRFPTPGDSRTDRIHLYQDSSALVTRVRPIEQGVELDAAYKSDRALFVVLQDSFFKDIGGRYSTADTLSLSFPVLHDPLLLQMDLSALSSHLVQVLRQDRVIHERRVPNGTQQLLFTDLEPGTYRVRIVRDANANGRWDSGDIFSDRPPEDVFISEEILLRVNWDNKLTIKY